MIQTANGILLSKQSKPSSNVLLHILKTKNFKVNDWDMDKNNPYLSLATINDKIRTLDKFYPDFNASVLGDNMVNTLWEGYATKEMYEHLLNNMEAAQ